MQRAPLIAIAVLLLVPGSLPHAQSAADRLISSWTLVAADKQAADETPVRSRTPRGLLVLDGAGNVFEFFSAALPDDPAAAALSNAEQTFAEFGGFWGRYSVDEAAGRIEFTAEAGVSPSVEGRRFSRSFELDGDRLVLTSTDEPQAQADTRWTWQRFPTVENLSPAYREVVGFWRHIEERQVDQSTGEVQRSSQRAPSVIVYTPAGFVGVHFPSLGREPFAGDAVSADEAQAALRGYIGYFGSLGVYPGEVSHNILSGISPATGSILRRYAEIRGDELIVTLQSATPRAADEDRPRTATEVVLKRLSGAEDMLPR